MFSDKEIKMSYSEFKNMEKRIEELEGIIKDGMDSGKILYCSNIWVLDRRFIDTNSEEIKNAIKSQVDAEKREYENKLSDIKEMSVFQFVDWRRGEC